MIKNDSTKIIKQFFLIFFFIFLIKWLGFLCALISVLILLYAEYYREKCEGVDEENHYF